MSTSEPDNVTRLIALDENESGARKRAPRGLSPQWPAPLAKEAFMGPVGELVRLVEPHTEADPAALTIQALVAFGSMIGPTPYFQHEASRHGTNLFAVLVGETSRGRKGTSWDWIQEVARRVDPGWASERVSSGLSSGEGVIWAVRDPIVKQESVKSKGRVTGEVQELLVDPGIADKRLCIVEGELAQALRAMQRDGNTLSPTLRAGWDSGNLRILTKNSPAVATGAHISMIGHITHQELKRLLTSNDSYNGLANRILWTCTRRSKLLPDGGSLQPEELNGIVASAQKAVAFARTVDRLPRSDEAARIWHELYPELSKDVPGLLGAVTSRAEAQVLRLSVLYALLGGCRVIDTQHILAATAIWDYSFESARYIFGDALGDPVADQIRTELEARPGGMTREEIRDLFDRHKSARQLDAALEVLRVNGLAESESAQSNGPGRPRTLWRATRSGCAESAVMANAEETPLSFRANRAGAPMEAN